MQSTLKNTWLFQIGNQIDLILTWSEQSYVVSTNFCGYINEHVDKNPINYEDEQKIWFGQQNDKGIKLLDFASPNS